MPKILNALVAALAICLCTTAWAGAGHHVSGDVYGVWSAGDTVFVDRAARVPDGKDLVVEPGVVIIFETDDYFEIVGEFVAEGTETHPIIVLPCEGWSGFSFLPNADHVQVLSYVVIPSGSPEPLRVVIGQSAMLRVEHCDFHALHSCLDLDDGRLWASWNQLRTSGLYSKAVRLNYLENDVTGACDSPYGNSFHDNIVKVDVPRASWGPTEEFSAALYINGSTNLCLSRNTLSVIAPASTIGAYFGDVAEAGSQLSALDSADVSVRSYDGVPKGVFNALSGSLRVLHCNIDVAVVDDNGPYRAAGVLASQTADVVVNSSNVVLDQDTFFFVPISGALLSVDYITHWSNSQEFAMGPGGPDVRAIELPASYKLGLDDPITSVEWGAHCYFADPRFLRQGEWGAWQNFVEVAAYYGIDSLSPCIDAGDAQWGYDPDNSLPDIGRYYYVRSEQTDVPRDERPDMAVALAPAYPNPFNAVTSVPFVMQRAGWVTLKAYDVTGREIGVLVAGLYGPGKHLVRFDGARIASGMYIIQLEVEGVPVAKQRLVLLK